MVLLIRIFTVQANTYYGLQSKETITRAYTGEDITLPYYSRCLYAAYQAEDGAEKEVLFQFYPAIPQFLCYHTNTVHIKTLKVT